MFIQLDSIARSKRILGLSQDIKRIKSVIQNLSNNPRPNSCTKLKGSNDYYRIRVGSYRIVYLIEDRILSILVVRVGHRRDIYR